MFRKVSLVAALVAPLLLNNSAIAQVSLNAGYNNSINSPYPTPIQFNLEASNSERLIMPPPPCSPLPQG